MPWFERGSYNVVKANSNKTNSKTKEKKTEPVLKRDSRLRSTLTLRFSSHLKRKDSKKTKNTVVDKKKGL